MKIYVPSDTTYNKCYVIQNENVIRGYDRTPQQNTNYNYRDYYYNSDYYYRDGNGTWSQYTTLPTCLSNDVITNDYWYRLDLTNILFIFCVLFLFIIYFPFRVFRRMFGRWLNV